MSADVTPLLEPRLKPLAISFDYETYYDKECSVKTLGADAYCRHPKFDPYLISVCDGYEAWAGHAKDFNWGALEGETVVAHNAAFETQVTSWGVRNGRWPDVKVKEWLCTANMSAYLCDRRSLDQASAFLLGRKVDKGVRDRAKGKTPDDMIREGWWEDMLKYGRGDVTDCLELFTKHGHKWPAFERRLSRLTIDQSTRGVHIDTDRLHGLKLAAQTALIKAEAALPWIATGSKPTSPLAVAESAARRAFPRRRSSPISTTARSCTRLGRSRTPPGLSGWPQSPRAAG